LTREFQAQNEVKRVDWEGGKGDQGKFRQSDQRIAASFGGPAVSSCDAGKDNISVRVIA
jgi:hypothetical protein